MCAIDCFLIYRKCVFLCLVELRLGKKFTYLVIRFFEFFCAKLRFEIQMVLPIFISGRRRTVMLLSL